jgi:hypothetical protein
MPSVIFDRQELICCQAAGPAGSAFWVLLDEVKSISYMGVS